MATTRKAEAKKVLTQIDEGRRGESKGFGHGDEVEGVHVEDLLERV